MQTQLSLYWLNELLNLNGYNLDFFIKNLTINGFEVEDCLKVSYKSKSTIALQLSITANRGDALSLRGIAREIKMVMTRFKAYQAEPPVFKVFGVSRALRRRRKFRRRVGVFYGGKAFRLRKRIYFNRYNRRRHLSVKRDDKKSMKWILRQTIFKFFWSVENTIYRSPKWKPNRLYFKQPVFNTNDPKIFSRFLCFKLENLKNLKSPGWLQKRLAYSGIVPQNDLSDYKNYIFLESGYPFEFYDLKKITSKCDSENFKLNLSHASDIKFTGTNNREYTLNQNILVLKANEEILSIAGVISNKDFAYSKDTDSVLIEGAIFHPKMIARQSRLLQLKTTRSNYYSKGGMDGCFFIQTWYRLLSLLKIANPQRKFKLHTSSYTSENESQIYHVPFVTWYAWHEVDIFASWDFWLREKKIAQVLGEAYYFQSIVYKQVYRKTKRLPCILIEDYLRKLDISYEFKYLPGEWQYFPIIYGRIPIPPRSTKRVLPPNARGWMPPRKYGKPSRNWLLRVPNYRKADIKTETDMIEEFVRIYGVDKIISIYPQLTSYGIADLNYQTRREITQWLLNEGFNELISYSLVNEKIKNNQSISLLNPIANEYSSLRTSLLPNLIQIASENIKQGNKVFEGFEYGHIFSKDLKGEFFERECLSGIFGGIELREAWSEKSEYLSWFEAKGKIEKMFEKFNFPVVWNNLNDNSKNLKDNDINLNFVHPYKAAKLYSKVTETFLGIFGELNPIIAKELAISSKFYLFEFDLRHLVTQYKKRKSNKSFDFKEYSSYPKLIKDLSFIIDKDLEIGSLLQFIYMSRTKFLSKLSLQDIYESDSLLSNQTSLCIQLVFQAKDKTLKNSDIEPWLKWITYKLKHTYNVVFR